PAGLVERDVEEIAERVAGAGGGRALQRDRPERVAGCRQGRAGEQQEGGGESEPGEGVRHGRVSPAYPDSSTARGSDFTLSLHSFAGNSRRRPWHTNASRCGGWRGPSGPKSPASI